jgi:hypothetical protein
VSGIDLMTIDRLSRGKLGTHDIVCPICAPYHSPRGQRRKVLHAWRVEPGFATYCCARCGEAGYARDCRRSQPQRQQIAAASAQAAEHIRIDKALWSQRKRIAYSIGEIYLRDKRGISCPLPATLRFLPARGDYAPAMVAAFGFACETEPGIVAIADDAVRATHTTRLLPDGSRGARSVPTVEAFTNQKSRRC